MQVRSRWTTIGLTVAASAFALAAWVTSALQGQSVREAEPDPGGDLFAAASAACKCPTGSDEVVVSNECSDYGTFKKCSDMSCQTKPKDGSEITDKFCEAK